jgi:nucleotide-binding universal stress UspA family protein
VKILAGLQETPDGEYALRYAATVARDRGAQLVIVGFVPEGAGVQGDRLTGERAAMAAKAEAVAEPLRASGIDVRIVIPTGVARASEAILRAADETGADRIVINMRRRSRVGKLVLGSNSQDILLAAEVDVLAVKRPSET